MMWQKSPINTSPSISLLFPLPDMTRPDLSWTSKFLSSAGLGCLLSNESGDGGCHPMKFGDYSALFECLEQVAS